MEESTDNNFSAVDHNGSCAQTSLTLKPKRNVRLALVSFETVLWLPFCQLPLAVCEYTVLVLVLIFYVFRNKNLE